MTIEATIRRINRVVASCQRVLANRQNFFLWLQHTGLLTDGILLHDGTPLLFHGYDPDSSTYRFLTNDTSNTDFITLHDGTEYVLHS